ncbi:MAG: enoyl-CoA hydratase [Kurthia sp.]|nr:enoyl-CoA hydratase [Candidatus Kurthia equi]
MTYQTILFEKEERVATISFNRPQAMNALDLVMMEELGQVFEELHKDKEIQIVILKGEGRAFSSGGDIKGMLTGGLDIEKAMVLVSNYIRSLYTLPMITIAQVHGAAAGLGLSTALACDFVIAEETSKIAMNFIGIGLVPDGGGHFFMQERLGAVKAKQAIWKGEVMPGTKAQKIGLVDELVAEGLLDEEVEKFKQALLNSPIAAMIATKEIINGSKINELNDALKQETKTQPMMRKTTDHLEGIQAFVEKRQPKFTGK